MLVLPKRDHWSNRVKKEWALGEAKENKGKPKKKNKALCTTAMEEDSKKKLEAEIQEDGFLLVENRNNTLWALGSPEKVATYPKKGGDRKNSTGETNRLTCRHYNSFIKHLLFKQAQIHNTLS